MTSLVERIEAATGPCRELDCRIEAAIGKCAGEWRVVGPPTYNPPRFFSGQAGVDWIGYDLLNVAPAYTSSLDAAMTLVPEGWNWMAGNRNQPSARAYVENGKPAFEGFSGRRNPERQWFECVAVTPALALCAAALRARGVE